MTPKEKSNELMSMSLRWIDDSKPCLVYAEGISSEICDMILDYTETFKDSAFYSHAKSFWTQVKKECNKQP